MAEITKFPNPEEPKETTEVMDEIRKLRELMIKISDLLRRSADVIEEMCSN